VIHAYITIVTTDIYALLTNVYTNDLW